MVTSLGINLPFMKKVVLIFTELQNLLDYASDFGLTTADMNIAEQALTAMLDANQVQMARIQYEAYVEELATA